MRRVLVSIFLAALALTAVGCSSNDKSNEPPTSLLPLHVEGKRIIDANGGAVILRGVGVNQLGDYFQANPEIQPVFPLEKSDFERMQKMGLNSIRLVVSWSFLEPQRGVFDEEYIAKIKQAVEWARESDIYVIIDMHQDAWGKSIATTPGEVCEAGKTPNVGWDGAPEWATYTDGLSTCISLSREIAPAVMRAWQSFYEDRDGIQERFAQTWARLAETFAGDPAVAGYNLLNEPNWGEDLETCVQTLKPAMNRRVLEAIRAAEGEAHHKIIFFEPSAMWSFYPQETPVPFTDDPDIVYAPHIYNSIGPDVVGVETNFANAAAEAEAYGCPFWFGEWWGSEIDQAAKVAALEDQYQIGSARWLWKVSCGDPHFMTGCWPECEDHFPVGDRNSVIQIECGTQGPFEGADRDYHPTDKLILSRPYPRSFPSPATYQVDPAQRRIAIEGDSPGGIPLVLWIPGEGELTIDSQGVGGVSRERAPGGWIVWGTPGKGAWRVEAKTL